MITDFNTKLSASQVVPVTASTITPSTNQLKLATGMKTNMGSVIGPDNLVLKVNVDVAPTISTNANGSGAEPAVTFQLRGSQNADMSGSVILLQSGGYRPGVSARANSTAYTAGTVAAKTGSVRSTAVPNGFQYRCTTSGTSAASEPVFPTVPGQTVTDGTAVWTCEVAEGRQLIAGKEIDFCPPVPAGAYAYLDLAYSVGATALDGAFTVTAQLVDGAQVNWR